jgi:hypothetical protein
MINHEFNKGQLRVNDTGSKADNAKVLLSKIKPLKKRESLINDPRFFLSKKININL